MERSIDALRARLAAHKERGGTYGDLIAFVPRSTLYKITSGAIKSPGSDTMDRLNHGLDSLGVPQ